VVVQADDVDDLGDELRIGGQLEGVLQVGLRSKRFQIRPIVDFDRPVRWAIEARDQCVSWPGTDSRVATTTPST
jgi:hypothetical protein